MLKGLLSSKWVLLSIAALIAISVFFYQRNEINKAVLETTRTELKQAQRDIEVQTETILTMQRDALVQSELMKQANAGIAAAREQARTELQALTQRDLAVEANTNALALQDAINLQWQRYLTNIQRLSQ